MEYQEEYNKQRYSAYDRILKQVQGHIDALTPPITALITTLEPSNARDAAERDIWTLFRNGIQHLKDGGQLGAPGSFGEAISKASLRSAPISVTLGVKPPKFDENYINVEFDSGASEAVWRCRRMLEALEADAAKSKQVMRSRLFLTVPLHAPDSAPVNDPELTGVFDAAQRSAEGGTEDTLMAAVRRQAVLSFNMLCDLYVPMTAHLKNEIAELFTVPPPKPSPKGQTFDR